MKTKLRETIQSVLLLALALQGDATANSMAIVIDRTEDPDQPSLYRMFPNGRQPIEYPHAILRHEPVYTSPERIGLTLRAGTGSSLATPTDQDLKAPSFLLSIAENPDFKVHCEKSSGPIYLSNPILTKCYVTEKSGSISPEKAVEVAKQLIRIDFDITVAGFEKKRLPAESIVLSTRPSAVYQSLENVLKAGLAESTGSTIVAPRLLAEAAVVQALSFDPCGFSSESETLSAVFVDVAQKRDVCQRIRTVLPTDTVHQSAYIRLRLDLIDKVVTQTLEPGSGDTVTMRRPGSRSVIRQEFELLPVRDVIDEKTPSSYRHRYTPTYGAH